MTYLDSWIHQQAQDADVFVATADALDPLYFGPDAGQIMVRGEWNWSRQKIEPLWNRHIGMLGGMLGAKNIGSAPWRIADAVGLEAEIVLPKKDNRRLWTGILMHDFRVLHFMVTHPKEVREQFEPAATKLIASLRFPDRVLGVKTSPEGLPMPPDYTPADPQTILDDIPDPQAWRAYTGDAGAGALQSFYLRELPIHDWQMEEYVPFPGPFGLGFARFKLHRDKLHVTLGIMPSKTSGDSSLANVVFKISGP
ncbi:MAG: hypothetical protein EHM70_23175 [Chloroflexota bacterium]|nr:MAG: hypothetical protein EHM70_23175 [Chloroflexota bacterium]